MQNRSDWVDYAKAIGILLVVYGHVARGLYNAGIKIPIEVFKLADSIVYSFHMPLFFFISGLFFYSSFSKRGGKKLLLNKVDTIVYPYLVWSILQGTVEVLLSNYTNGELSYSEVFNLLWSPRAHFWFLYALFVVFIVASALFSIVSKKLAAFIFLLSGIAYIYPSMLPQGLVFKFISQNFIFFVFGIVFSLHFKDKNLSSYKFLILSACSFFLVQFLFHSTFHYSYLDKGLFSLLLAIVSIIFVISVSSYVSVKPNKLLSLIGASSMAIYLMHILAGSGIRVVASNFFHLDSFIIHLILGCAVSVLAPLLALQFINKLKIKYVFSAPISNLLIFLYTKLSKPLIK